ncbi:MAG TPA: hypothetical protein DEA96_03945 [Leptospiraceae bacterium]|nr:hypothetical protein [Spirochaetaceae bacterium]HBS04093.1 hypothetical protein [Leptospiraceae bacterium]|tara:strand:+ start:12867 stop:13211 length:345 start_codon:yes stop_codon:yes gene_type:complete
MRRILAFSLALSLVVLSTAALQADDEEACQALDNLSTALDEMATGVHNDELSPEDVQEDVDALKDMAREIQDGKLTAMVNKIAAMLNSRNQEGFVKSVDDLVDYIDSEVEENCQ